jgi:transcriptional regulator with XRE-family HTH domain
LDESISAVFGRVVRRLRKEAGLTQEALGLAAQLQRKYISSIELGEKQPSLLSILKLATALNTRPGTLLDLVDEEFREHKQSPRQRA